MPTIRFNTQFPGYEVLSELGRSNARILKARHLATGELVAIKHFALNVDADTLRRFQQESAIMTRIAHPNIVKVREVQLEAELPFLVMELIEGGSLNHLMGRPERMDIPTLVRLGLQMASALKAIHAQGIVHRDVKPENILYRPLPSGELHFLLTDFGVARLQERSTTLTGQSLLTYEYASPEQFNEPKSVGVATDYYSLGVVLYECLFGSVPFRVEGYSGIAAFMNSVLTETPPALASVTPAEPVYAFIELLTGLLQKNPAQRLADPDELTWRLKQAELNYLQGNRPVPRTDVPRTEAVASSVARPAADRKQTQPAPQPSTPSATPPKNALGALKWVAFALVVGLIGWGWYAWLSRSDGSPFSSEPVAVNPGTTAVPPAVVVAKEDSLRRKQAEEAQRREKRKREALAAAKSLKAWVAEAKPGIFGGFKGIRIFLRNPSAVSFASVVVRLDYVKENGSVHKSEKLYFNPIGPKMTLSRRAPDSNRGTQLRCTIIQYEFNRELEALLKGPPVAGDSSYDFSDDDTPDRTMSGEEESETDSSIDTLP